MPGWWRTRSCPGPGSRPPGSCGPRWPGRRSRPTRRREEAGRAPRVRRCKEDAGTAALAGYGLPPADVLAADQQLTTRALALRDAGLPGSVEELRARAYLDALLDRDSTPTTPPSPAAPPSEAPPGRDPAATRPPGPAAPPSDAPPSDAPPSDAPPSDAPPSGAPLGRDSAATE